MKTLTSMITVAALISGLAVANAQTARVRNGMGVNNQGSERIQTNRLDQDLDGSLYDPRSTTGVAPNDVSHGQPNEQNQQEERDSRGRIGGDTQHPAR
jgi:hypothetical protein